MLVKNNAYATITGSISAGTANPLTITVTSGHGARFSYTGSGNWFMAALVDEGPNKVEIVHCYQHDSGSPDTFLCLRARDGTTARDWSPGDNLIQISDTESSWGDALDQFELKNNIAGGGTANAITGTIICGYQQLLDGMRFRVKAAAANTGATTFAVTFDHGAFGGTTYPQTARAIVKDNNVALVGGEIPGAGYYLDLVYRSATNNFLLLNPTITLSASVVNALVTNASLLRTIYVSLSDSPYTWQKSVNNPSFIEVELLGGGGGGGGVSTANATKAGGGGGAGQLSRKRILNASLGATETVTIGSGGASGSASGGNGGNGGLTSFGSHCSAGGGIGGGGDTTGNGANGGNGGSGGSGDFAMVGSRGGDGSANAIGGQGGGTIYGSGAPGKFDGGDGYSAGVFGTGGGGASGTSTLGRVGGLGGPGLAVIREYK